MSSPVARYESFLINNVSTISTLESSLRSVTWFLPGRFKDAELASEARQLLSFTSILVSDIISPLVSASLNVMSLYHDTLIARITQSDPKYKPLIPTSLHTRYTRAWSDKNYRYKWAARALELVRFTELVIEMGLRRKMSSRNKWRAIVLLEVLKCVFDKYRTFHSDSFLGPSCGLFYCESPGDRFLVLQFLSVILTRFRYHLHPTHHPQPLLRPPPLLLLQQHPTISRIIIYLFHPIRSLHFRRLLVLIRLWKTFSFRKLSRHPQSNHRHPSSAHSRLPSNGYPKLFTY